MPMSRVFETGRSLCLIIPFVGKGKEGKGIAGTTSLSLSLSQRERVKRCLCDPRDNRREVTINKRGGTSAIQYHWRQTVNLDGRVCNADRVIPCAGTRFQ